MLSKEETEIWREGYRLHEQYRDALTTPEAWTEFSDHVLALMNGHGDVKLAYWMGVFLMDMMNDAYRDGGKPEPVQKTFFDEEAYT